jgi:hypothetical protein
MIWQYHTEVFGLNELAPSLTAAGNEGWELVSACAVPIGGSRITGEPPTLGMLCIFKRPGKAR